MSQKRYYFLKLHENWFDNPRVKKIRKIAGGDTYTIIYLKLMLFSLKSEGVIEYEGIEPSMEDELALKLDEDATNIKITLNFLRMQGLVEESHEFEDEYLLPEVPHMLESKAASTFRAQKSRAKKKAVLQCNTNAAPLQHGAGKGNTEKEREQEKDKEKDKEREQEPTLSQITDFVKAKNLSISSQSFFAYYQAQNWKDKYGNKITTRNFQIKLLQWATSSSGTSLRPKTLSERNREALQKWENAYMEVQNAQIQN